MNVLLVTSVPLVPPWDQGDKNLAMALIKRLQNVYFQVFSTGHNAISAANVTSHGVFKSRNPNLRDKTRAFRYLAMHSSFLSKNPSKISVDIIHSIYRPTPISSLVLRLSSGFIRVPSIHTITATADEHELRQNLFLANKVISMSHSGLEKLKSAEIAGAAHIPAGIDLSRWRDLSKQQNMFKRRLGLEGKPAFLFPGHYGAGQGADLMIAAIPKIIEQYPEAHFIFACRIRSSQERKIETKYKTELSKMGLLNHVRFFNTVPDMVPLIGACDVVVLPLRTMRNKLDIPTTLLEAMAAGKPIIVSDIDPLNEVVHEAAKVGFEIGFTLPDHNPEAWANVCTELLVNAMKAKDIGQQGREYVAQYHDIHNVARQYHDLYCDLIE